MRERTQIGGRPRIKREVRHLRVELLEGTGNVRARRMVVEHPATAGMSEDVFEQFATWVAAEADDFPGGHTVYL